MNDSKKKLRMFWLRWFTSGAIRVAYSYHCAWGHFGTIPHGSELEKKAKKHAASGYLDAICLSSAKCPQCIEEAKEQAKHDAEFWPEPEEFGQLIVDAEEEMEWVEG